MNIYEKFSGSTVRFLEVASQLLGGDSIELPFNCAFYIPGKKTEHCLYEDVPFLQDGTLTYYGNPVTEEEGYWSILLYERKPVNIRKCGSVYKELIKTVQKYEI